MQDEAILRIAPLDPWDQERRFRGEIRDLKVWDKALSPDTVRLLLHSPANN